MYNVREKSTASTGGVERSRRKRRGAEGRMGGEGWGGMARREERRGREEGRGGRREGEGGVRGVVGCGVCG